MYELKEIIQLKEIKDREIMSFEKMAGEIGVSALTVKYWIHGVFKPQPLAMEAIRKFIKKNEPKNK